ncbi:MAG: hypothetical protein K9G72_21400, partial [Rhodobacteraceae bacterium]|nr:hypothetical protein [Paracoccaceae bacterium]
MTLPTSSMSVIRSEYRKAFASDGTPFDPEQDLWSFRTLSSAININFTLLRNCMSSELLNSLKRSMQMKVTTGNLQTAGAAFRQFRNLVLIAHQRRDGTVEQIDMEDVAAWCARGNVAYLGQIRILTEVWKMLKLPGILTETHDFIAQIRVPSRNDKDAVRTWDLNRPGFAGDQLVRVTRPYRVCSSLHRRPPLLRRVGCFQWAQAGG